jgi:hypothetical protein
MKLRAPSPALQGRNVIARGEAPGNASQKISQALKGRHNPASTSRWVASRNCSAPSGRGNHRDVEPGALPRAITLRPFRAAQLQRLARLYERKLAALEALQKSLLHQAFNGQLTRDN